MYDDVERRGGVGDKVTMGFELLRSLRGGRELPGGIKSLGKRVLRGDGSTSIKRKYSSTFSRKFDIEIADARSLNASMNSRCHRKAESKAQHVWSNCARSNAMHYLKALGLFIQQITQKSPR